MALEEIMSETTEVITGEDKQTTETPEKTEGEQTEVKEEKEDSQEEVFTGKLNQFTAKSADEYIKKIEDAYLNSSTEGQRLNRELKDKQSEMEVISKVINADPSLKTAFADKLYGAGYDNDDSGFTPAQVAVIKQAVQEAVGNVPAIKNIDADRTEKDREVYTKFLQGHPELNTNPQMVAELEEYFGVIANATAQKGELVNFEKTLSKAWNVVSGGDSLDTAKKIYQKDAASMASTASEGNSKSPRSLSPQEKRLAEAFGLSDKDYLEGQELVKKSKE